MVAYIVNIREHIEWTFHRNGGPLRRHILRTYAYLTDIRHFYDEPPGINWYYAFCTNYDCDAYCDIYTRYITQITAQQFRLNHGQTYRILDKDERCRRHCRTPDIACDRHVVMTLTLRIRTYESIDVLTNPTAVQSAPRSGSGRIELGAIAENDGPRKY